MAKNNQPKKSRAKKETPAKKQDENKKTTYVEPADYFPKELRKKYGLGEFASPQEKSSGKKNAKKTSSKKAAGRNTSSEKNRTKNGSEKKPAVKKGGKNPNAQKNSRAVRKPKPEVPIKVTFLGGLNEVGKNMTLYECQGDMILVDCGLAFPDPDMLGVDLVIPDFSYAVENADKIKGIFITHGHEDHIGGLAFLLKEMNIPVYSTRLTIGLIEGKLREHGLLDTAKLNVVNPGDKVNLGCFEVELIHVNHSIPDAVALAIKSPAGVIVQTGDFKIDTTPIDGGVIDMARLAELGTEGVLCLLSDSTNAEKPGFTESESKVGESFERLFARAEGKRLIVATFASNIHRVQQIINEAHKLSRKVALSGRSLENVVSIAAELGYINIPDDTLIGIDAVKRYPDDKIVVITTGSQGEPMSALYRMAFSEHRKVDIGPNDFVIISATPIPGNERMVGRVVDELLKLGAEVVYERMYEVHVSGHACQEELKIMMGLTKPKYFIPVHGEQKHLRKHAGLAYSMGIEPQNVIIADNGRVVEMTKSYIKTVGEVQSGMVFVDGSGVGDVGSVVLRDRTKLAEEGIVIIAAAYETETCTVVSGPDVITRGFVYVKESEEFLEKTRRICEDVLADCMYENINDYLVLKNRLRDAVSRFIYSETRRSPVVLPIIMEV